MFSTSRTSLLGKLLEAAFVGLMGSIAWIGSVFYVVAFVPFRSYRFGMFKRNFLAQALSS